MTLSLIVASLVPHPALAFLIGLSGLFISGIHLILVDVEATRKQLCDEVAGVRDDIRAEEARKEEARRRREREEELVREIRALRECVEKGANRVPCEVLPPAGFQEEASAETSDLHSALLRESAAVRNDLLRATAELRDDQLKATAELRNELLKATAGLRNELLKATAELREGAAEDKGLANDA